MPEIETLTWRGMLVEIEGTFRHAEAPPNVSNPDGVGFSNPGSGAEVDIRRAWFVGDKENIPFSGALIEELRSDEDYIAEELELV